MQASTLNPSVSNSSTLAGNSTFQRSRTGTRAQTPTSTEKNTGAGSPNSNYLKSLTSLCNQFIRENNHLGLALIARQKGIPVALRQKVWPILLKYHPYVINPYLNATVEKDSDNDIPVDKIHADLMKYFRVRNSGEKERSNSNSRNGSIPSSLPSSNGSSPTPMELSQSLIEAEIVKTLEDSIHKFFKKWGAIIKYDSGFAWIALNLAEWFPPIPNSSFVLIGRDVINKNDDINKHIISLEEIQDMPSYDSVDAFSDYTSECGSEDYIDNALNLTNYMSQRFKLDDARSISSHDSELNSTSMTFAEVFERLVLVLLHSNEHSQEEAKDGDRDDNGNDIHTDDVTPQVSNSESTTKSDLTLVRQEIYFKSGEIDKRMGFFLKAFNKLLPELYKSFTEDEIINNKNRWLTWWLKYSGAKVLNKFDRARLWDSIIGFRLPNYIYEKYSDHELSSKTAKAYNKFYSNDIFQFENSYSIEFDSDYFWYKPQANPIDLKWSQCDYQYQVIFVFISILMKNEGKLMEYDNFEVLEFLGNMKKKNMYHKNNSDDHININSYFEKIMKDAGELWRNWLWNEIREDIISS
ncbi:hypothetical protein WICPIJ_007400 [Wickerhamomyces pijperi]|uniref:Oxidant-induced cell-cycle arrest protein 5 n=1 Tax=Wickerhamomyces pijperi TaxID=599730 RepID=A0A9P8Q1Q9_WICPI|nr:hypothetical protein WICPIJ_007400 [Wickerhamomyces pijperi]